MNMLGQLFSSYDFMIFAANPVNVTDELPTQILIAAGMIVVSGVIGLLVGFFLGSQYGRMSGELRVLKSIRSDRPRRSRSRTELEREPVP